MRAARGMFNGASGTRRTGRCGNHSIDKGWVRWWIMNWQAIPSRATMPPSLRFTQPNSLTPRPDPSTTLTTTSSTSIQSIPVTPFNEVSQNLRFNARVPIAGMHTLNHASDTVRTGIHLPSSSFSTIEPFETIEFDGSSLQWLWLKSRYCCDGNKYSSEPRRWWWMYVF